MILTDVFDERLINLDLKSTTKSACFEELAEKIAAVRPGLDKAEILAAVNKREAKLTTTVRTGIAVPHGYCRGFSGVIGAIGFSRKGIDYEAADRKPVHLVFLLLLGEGDWEKHLQVLSQLLLFLQSGAPASIKRAKNPREVHEIFLAELG